MGFYLLELFPFICSKSILIEFKLLIPVTFWTDRVSISNRSIQEVYILLIVFIALFLRALIVLQSMCFHFSLDLFGLLENLLISIRYLLHRHWVRLDDWLAVLLIILLGINIWKAFVPEALAFWKLHISCFVIDFSECSHNTVDCLFVFSFLSIVL